jgi:hypothetical protein
MTLFQINILTAPKWRKTGECEFEGGWENCEDTVHLERKNTWEHPSEEIYCSLDMIILYLPHKNPEL